MLRSVPRCIPVSELSEGAGQRRRVKDQQPDIGVSSARRRCFSVPGWTSIFIDHLPGLSDAPQLRSVHTSKHIIQAAKREPATHAVIINSCAPAPLVGPVICGDSHLPRSAEVVPGGRRRRWNRNELLKIQPVFTPRTISPHHSPGRDNEQAIRSSGGILLSPKSQSPLSRWQPSAATFSSHSFSFLITLQGGNVAR